ncbi:MAG: hypothetical protein QM681_15180 [Novosphingobium sp.]
MLSDAKIFAAKPRDKDPAEKLATVLKPLPRGRQHAITDLGRLRKMIDDAETDYARPLTRLALRLLALTAVRPSELGCVGKKDSQSS